MALTRYSAFSTFTASESDSVCVCVCVCGGAFHEREDTFLCAYGTCRVVAWTNIVMRMNSISLQKV